MVAVEGGLVVDIETSSSREITSRDFFSSEEVGPPEKPSVLLGRGGASVTAVVIAFTDGFGRKKFNIVWDWTGAVLGFLGGEDVIFPLGIFFRVEWQLPIIPR